MDSGGAVTGNGDAVRAVAQPDAFEDGSPSPESSTAMVSEVMTVNTGGARTGRARVGTQPVSGGTNADRATIDGSWLPSQRYSGR